MTLFRQGKMIIVTLWRRYNFSGDTFDCNVPSEATSELEEWGGCMW